MLPADGKPARSFTVDGQQFESPDGRFELPSVKAGPVRLRIEASGATERRGASVDMTRECGPGRSFSTGGTEYRTALAEEIVAWTNQAARARARRISDGDLDAFREALWDQGKLDPLSRREALAALAGIDTLAALRELVREELNGFEARWRCPSDDCSRQRGFFPGLGGAALASVARRTETSRVQVLARVADGLSESEARELARLAWQEDALKAELAGIPDTQRNPGAPTAGGAAFLEEVRRLAVR